MTESEARSKIKYRIANEMRKAGENKEEYEDLEIALKVMKEIREYRELGTVEELKFLVENVGSIKLLKEYSAIGTVEELKAYKNGDCMNDCEHYDNCANYIFSKGYAKAVDEFANRLCQEFIRTDEDGNLYVFAWITDFREIAEQMKGGETE